MNGKEEDFEGDIIKVKIIPSSPNKHVEFANFEQMFQ